MTDDISLYNKFNDNVLGILHYQSYVTFVDVEYLYSKGKIKMKYKQYNII